MSGRGKGGKGLGKGGAKRHRKVLRDNIQGELAIAAETCFCLPVLGLRAWCWVSCNLPRTSPHSCLPALGLRSCCGVLLFVRHEQTRDALC